MFTSKTVGANGAGRPSRERLDDLLGVVHAFFARRIRTLRPLAFPREVQGSAEPGRRNGGMIPPQLPRAVPYDRAPNYLILGRNKASGPQTD